MQNFNSKTTDEIRDVSRSQDAINVLPSSFSPTIQFVADVNPKHFRMVTKGVHGSRATSGDGTVLTTSANRDTYLHAITYGLVKDATCDVASGIANIAATVQGKVIAITGLPVLTTTAQQLVVTLTFKNPVLLDRNTTVLFTGTTYTAGTMVRTATLLYSEQ